LLKEPDKLVFILVNVLIVLSVTFAVGMHAGANRTFAYRAFVQANDALDQFWEEKVRQEALGLPVHFLQPAKHSGDGVTVNALEDDDSLILLAGFMENGNHLRLIRRDGSVVAKWPVRYMDHFPEPASEEQAPRSDWNVDLHGALVLPDGSVVFNYEYNGTVKLSRCGEVVWKLNHPTHHSIETAEGGGFWVPGRTYIPKDQREALPPFTWARSGEFLAEDLILKVSEDGRIAMRKSVPEILMDGGLESLMTATGSPFRVNSYNHTEIVHVNKIAELSTEMAPAFPDFAAGDLMVSLREYNLVLVVDPDTWQIKWHQIGPWLRQHDPEFGADGSIYVYNNNAYYLDWDRLTSGESVAPIFSSITRVDRTRSVSSIAYGGGAAEPFFSLVRGKLDPRPGGGVLITEFDAGRAFEVAADGTLLWEYINRYDEDRVLELTEARAYPADYFTVDDWSCP